LKKSGLLNAGSVVRLWAVPNGLEDHPDFPTRSTFEKCVGREFVVAGFNDVGMVELNIESVTGSLGETIWVEPELLKLISK
jgi:hypothetical protein